MFCDAILDRIVHHAHRMTLTGGLFRRLSPSDASTASDAEPTLGAQLTPLIGLDRNRCWHHRNAQPPRRWRQEHRSHDPSDALVIGAMRAVR